jgi:hypothetical protein
MGKNPANIGPFRQRRRLPRSTRLALVAPRTSTSTSRARAAIPRVVRAENLNPDVFVMQPANQGVRHDASDLLNRATDRTILVQ